MINLHSKFLKDLEMKSLILKSLTYKGNHVNDTLDGAAWVGHIPFAYWIVAALKPNVLVELGTHGGGSYFSFCDSVLENDLKTQTFAVDTWKGDPQAGTYGKTIFDKVNHYNNKKFFKENIDAKDFDDALSVFEDSSVDFLHIDGFHSYEAVSHDFYTWKPKLTENSVVLFHDTHEMQKGFGVHRLWAELKHKNPDQCFEFEHSHGLGVYFAKSKHAAINFRNSFEIDFAKAFRLLSICGEQIYVDMNGFHSKPYELDPRNNKWKKILSKFSNRNL